MNSINTNERAYVEALNRGNRVQLARIVQARLDTLPHRFRLCAGGGQPATCLRDGKALVVVSRTGRRECETAGEAASTIARLLIGPEAQADG